VCEGVVVPPLEFLRVREHVHGHLGWLAALALIHPAILLRRAGRRAHWAVGFAVGLVTVAAAMGLSFYDAYRERLRQPIFASAPAIGYLFERKEHLAFGVVAFTWIGAITYAAAISADATLRDPLRRVAHRAFVISATLAVIAATLGTAVAAYKTF
jgi:hypothetical protein